MNFKTFFIVFLLLFIFYAHSPLVHNSGTVSTQTKSIEASKPGVKSGTDETNQISEQNKGTGKYDIYPDFAKSLYNGQSQLKTAHGPSFSDITQFNDLLKKVKTSKLNANVTQQNTTVPLTELSIVMNLIMNSLYAVFKDDLVLVAIHRTSRSTAQVRGKKVGVYVMYVEMYSYSKNQTLQLRIHASGSTDKNAAVHSIDLSTPVSNQTPGKSEYVFAKWNGHESTNLYAEDECNMDEVYNIFEYN